MKKGTRVFVKWWDIQAYVQHDEPIDPILTECVGWVERDTKTVLELTYCRYTDKTKFRDGIVMPKGCVESVEEI